MPDEITLTPEEWEASDRAWAKRHQELGKRKTAAHPDAPQGRPVSEVASDITRLITQIGDITGNDA
jgi:hypothetical protein